MLLLRVFSFLYFGCKEKKIHTKEKKSPKCIPHPRFTRLWFYFGCAESLTHATVIAPHARITFMYSLLNFTPSPSITERIINVGETTTERACSKACNA